MEDSTSSPIQDNPRDRDSRSEKVSMNDVIEKVRAVVGDAMDVEYTQHLSHEEVLSSLEEMGIDPTSPRFAVKLEVRAFRKKHGISAPEESDDNQGQ